jgi:hypothetical protein
MLIATSPFPIVGLFGSVFPAEQEFPDDCDPIALPAAIVSTPLSTGKRCYGRTHSK